MKTFRNMSLREKDLWGELLIDVLVAIYYFPRAIALISNQQDAELNRELAGLVGSTIVVAIVAAVVVFGAIHLSGETEPKDERDSRFEVHANRFAYWGLNSLLVLILFLLVGSQYAEIPLPGTGIVNLGPLGVGHLILLAMVLASTIKAITQLYQYRLGS